MIAKAKSITHGGNAIDYALEKKDAEVIDKRYVIGDNGKEIKSEFKIFQDLNHICINNDISFVLSPEPSDGNKLTNDDFKAIADDFLKEMKLDKHQAIIIKHNDKKHTHLHIFVNRIDSNGKAYKDNFISKKSQAVADRIAIKRNLTRAKIVHLQKKEKSKEIRKEIFTIHNEILSLRPSNFKEYASLMAQKNVEILPTINKKGNMQGYRVKYKESNFKATEVHRKMALSKMNFMQRSNNIYLSR